VRMIFFIVPSGLAAWLARPFRGLGERLAEGFPGLGYDLKLAGSEYGLGEYLIISLINAFAWAVLMLLLVFVLFFTRGMMTPVETVLAFASPDAMLAFLVRQKVALLPPAVTFVLLAVFFTRYPRIIAGKIVEAVDRDLIYALKDLMLQINSGVSLFNAMRNVSRSGYGNVSDEFAKVVQDISTGEGQDKALEKMALRTESEFLRRTIWQIVTALKAGASLQGALYSVVQALHQYQSQNVKSYIQELNLWILLYIMASVAIPSLGVTLLVVLSTFGGIGVNEWFIISLLAACFISQVMLIEFIKIRRPVLRV